MGANSANIDFDGTFTSYSPFFFGYMYIVVNRLYVGVEASAYSRRNVLITHRQHWRSHAPLRDLKIATCPSPPVDWCRLAHTAK